MKKLINTRTLILGISLLMVAYLFSFKNPLKTDVIRTELDDSTFYKLTAIQKRFPEYALSGLTIADSLKIELFASEPLITNPTNIDVDARGRVWLCEGYNYRPQLNADKTVNAKGDRIVILEDTDGDGLTDKTKVFYQGNDVNAALGIAVLGNKAIVSCSPYVFVLTDTDGDDVADKKEIMFQGIGGEQHDHGMHSFVFGPDGKLYFNFGNAGWTLKDKNGNPVKDKYGNIVEAVGKPFHQGMVFRCNPDGSDVEVLGHNFRNNYEVAVDAFGTMWQSDNDDDGNKAVRINYVMEFGNYGYTDEMTGAGWQARRLNSEKEIPRKHWYQNDPGVIPNLLITGSGSPTGMLIYEGTLLPKVFRNQMIHTDAGPKVVRAYPVTKDGAGYTAKMVNLVVGKDDWFRPSDVCTAPDGSLIIADWYDPGVGGHQRGDIVKGRIYRLTTPEKPGYKITPADLSTPENAAMALVSPNVATRYLAWEKLKSFGPNAEKGLSKLLSSSDPRHRARALWFLVKNNAKPEKYVNLALADPDEDVKIAGIRMARQTLTDITGILQKLAKDKSPQIRREVGIALRNVPANSETAKIWTELATQYDGKDRWYLEALGLGADKNWDAYFTAWKNKVGENWNTPAGRDIIWRARATDALPLLVKIINDPATDAQETPKFFRAFDFHKDSLKKREILFGLLSATGKNANDIQVMAMNQLSASDLQYSTALKEVLYKRLGQVKATPEYLDLVKKFQLKDQQGEMFNIIVNHPEPQFRAEAMKVFILMGGLPEVEKAIKTKPVPERVKIMESMLYTESKPVLEFKKSILLDETQPLEVRKAVIKSFEWGWDGQDYFLEMIKAGQLPKALEPAAGNLLFNVYRMGVREEAAKYIKVKSVAAGKPLPPINELAQKKGDVVNGAKMYNRACLGCHVVNGKGVDFGPGLSEIGSKFGKDGLYLAILMPDAGVSFGYEGYILKLKNGGGGAGIIVSQTENDIELKTMGGIINKYPRTDVVEKKMMEKSLMPSNLHASMSEQDLVDLVEYLSSLKKAN